MAHPLSLPIALGPTAHQQSSPGGDGTSATPNEVHLHRHQQLDVVVQGFDPVEHARVVAEAENAVSYMRHVAQDFRARAEQQTANTQKLKALPHKPNSKIILPNSKHKVCDACPTTC